MVGAEVVDVEYEFFREEFRVTPDDPAYAWVDEAVLVTRDVDADNFWKTEVPDEAWADEWSNKAARSSID